MSSFANLEKAISSAKTASKNWYSKVSQTSFESEVDDLLLNHTWPTPKLETWKYTNISRLSKLDYALSEEAAPKTLPEFWLRFLDNTFDSSFVFWNGEFNSDLSRASKSTQFKFSQAKSDEGFKKLNSSTDFEKMNQLLLRDLYLLEVNKNEKIEKPIALLFLSSNGETQIHSSRIQFVMNEFSEAKVLEIHAGVGPSVDRIENHICEFNLKTSSHLEHNFLNMMSRGASNFYNKKFELAGHSVLRSLHLDIGGELTRTETYVNLNEKSAEAFVNGIYLNQEKQHTDHQGIIRHVAPETLSHQLFKGILADQSKAVFNAKVRIEQTAPKSNAEQLNKNLLLSNKAEIDSLPRLEIFNDDVKATHGSASGQIDPAQLFYLISRAISREQAMQLLVEGYAFEMLSGIDPMIAVKLKNILSEKLSLFKNEVLK